MRRTFGSVERYAERNGIEVTRDRRGGQRYEVIEYNVPGATSYGCKDLEEVMQAINEILYEQDQRKRKAGVKLSRDGSDIVITARPETSNQECKIVCNLEQAQDLVDKLGELTNLVKRSISDRYWTAEWMTMPDSLWRYRDGELCYLSNGVPGQRRWHRCGSQVAPDRMDTLYTKLNMDCAIANLDLQGTEL